MMASDGKVDLLFCVLPSPSTRLDAPHGGAARRPSQQGQLCHPVSAEITGGRPQLGTVLVLPGQVLLQYWQGPGCVRLLQAVHRQIRSQCRHLVFNRVRIRPYFFSLIFVLLCYHAPTHHPISLPPLSFCLSPFPLHSLFNLFHPLQLCPLLFFYVFNPLPLTALSSLPLFLNI